MKTDIKSLVVATYGFVTSNKKATVNQNKKKYVMLATRGAFTCKVRARRQILYYLTHCPTGTQDAALQI